MGFWNLFSRPKEPPRRRGPSKSATERLALRRERYLAALQKTNPAKYQQIMDAELQLSNAFGGDKVGEALDLLRRLKDEGLLGDPNNIEDRGWIKDIATAAAAMFVQMQQAQMMVARPAPADAPPVATPEPSAELPMPKTEEPRMSLMSSIIIGQLNGKTPEQAAEWLISQPQPEAKQLVQALCNTPDDRLLLFLDQAAKQVPDLAGLVNWLRGRPDWFVKTVQEVRQKASRAAMGF